VVEDDLFFLVLLALGDELEEYTLFVRWVETILFASIHTLVEISIYM